jgi:hypothetical protein
VLCLDDFGIYGHGMLEGPGSVLGSLCVGSAVKGAITYLNKYFE